jgi:hypothetical protein
MINPKDVDVKIRKRIQSMLNDMKRRCYNTSHHNYKHYGERGITICKEWLETETYIPFFNWALTNGYEQHLEIDRIDNNKGYSPDNCRFSTQSTQARNTRPLTARNTSGYRGVSKTRSGSWKSKIVVDNKNIELGTFVEKRDAVNAYVDYVIKNNTGHTYIPWVEV